MTLTYLLTHLLYLLTYLPPGASSKPVLSSFDSSKFSLAFGQGLKDLGAAKEID